MNKILIIPISILLLFSCNNINKTDTKVFKIGAAVFSHETCTFCPRETGIKEFEYYGPPLKGNDVLSEGAYIKGFANRMKEYDNVILEGITSPRDALGGSSGSWITTEAFDKYTGLMQDDIRANGPYDGIYLSLHGGMAVTGVLKPEAEIVRRIRKVAGDIPIIVTLDLHANEDHELSDVATAVIIVKRFPHYDSHYQGERAARLMVNILKGDYKPVMSTRKPGVITPSVYQGTGVSPAMEIMERARRWEDRIPGTYVSVAFGFAYADVPDVGATVMVVTNDDQKLADQIADDMNEYIWRVRKEFAGKKLPGPAEGVSLSISAAKKGKTPVIIADHSDRTGNSTHIMAELIKQGAKNFCIATLADKKLIDRLEELDTKTGDKIIVMVGGYADEYAGTPVEIKGTLEYFDKYSKFNKIAVVKFGNNNTVIITPELHQVMTTDILKFLKLDIKNIDILLLKSRVHFRRGFYETGIAGAIFEVDAPGLGPADLTAIPYKNIPKNIYPIYRKD
ncbi:MAG: M81 family metallopeptidase [Bacteroidales bacterium]